MADYLLAIDQGTTSTRAIVFDALLKPVAVAQQEFKQIYPGPGQVEHDPEEIWATTVATVRGAIAKAAISAREIAGIGITNQRETTVVWDRATGRPIHHAIVWQDRRTADVCAALRKQGHEALISRRTGLLLDPYFSATKIGWLLDHVDGIERLIAGLRLSYPFLSDGHARRLARAYGTRVRDILASARSLGDLGPNLGADLTAAEVRYLMMHEWAQTPDDVLWRRTKLGLRTSRDERARLLSFMTDALGKAAGPGAGTAQPDR